MPAALRRTRRLKLTERFFPARLRLVESLVGGAHQLRRACAVVRVGRHADTHVQREACLAETVDESQAKLLRLLLRRVCIGVGEEDRELVAAETRDLRVGADDLGEHEPDLAQRRVAELVSGPVVQVLEVVAVHHGDGQRQPSLLGAVELKVEHLLQAPPVEQAREGIGERRPALACQGQRGVDRCGRVRRYERCGVGA